MKDLPEFQRAAIMTTYFNKQCRLRQRVGKGFRMVLFRGRRQPGHEHAYAV